jgi:hypothetical protein
MREEYSKKLEGISNDMETYDVFLKVWLFLLYLSFIRINGISCQKKWNV